jgi:hypothetical protein
MVKVTPSEVVTDAAAVYPAVLDELIPSAWTTSSGTPIIRLRRIMISLSIIGYG